jgi:hypothetical protein
MHRTPRLELGHSPTSASDLGAVRAALNRQPDGVLDDVARRHGVPLRVVLDLLVGGAATPAPGAQFAEIWIDLVEWGPVIFIVHTEDGVFETKAPLPHGSEALGILIFMERARLAGICALLDAPRSILSTGRSSAAGPARCSSSTSKAAPCSRFCRTRREARTANCSPDSSPASSACVTLRPRLPNNEGSTCRPTDWCARTGKELDKIPAR